MSIAKQIKEKESALEQRERERDIVHEQLVAVEIEISNLEKELDAQRLLHDELEESHDNLSNDCVTLDDELTDLEEARQELPV